MSRQKILITGCAGYIGDVVVASLLNAGTCDVVGVDKLLYVDSYKRLGDRFEFVNLDVNTPAFEELLFKVKPVAIVHLAAIVGDGACAVDRELTLKTNVESVNTVLRYLAKYPNTRFVFPSTCSVYGDNDELLNEESAVNPLSLYAESKLIAETNIKRTSPKNHVIFRLGTVYGLSTEFGRIRADLVANIMTFKACENRRLEVFGGNQWRPMISVVDVGCILAEAVFCDYKGTYILSSENFTIADMADRIKKVIKSTSEVLKTEMKTEDLRNYKVDTAKADAEDICPYLDFDREIKNMADFYRSGRIKNVWSNIYNNSMITKEMYEARRT